MQQAAAAIAEAVAGQGVAEFAGLVRVAEAIDAFGQGGFVVEQAVDLVGADGGGVVADAEDLQQAGGGAVGERFEQYGATAGFVQGLGEEMGEAVRRGDAGGREQGVPGFEGTGVVGEGAGGDPGDDINGT